MTHTQSLALLGLFFAACGDEGKDDDDTGLMGIDDPNDYADSGIDFENVVLTSKNDCAKVTGDFVFIRARARRPFCARDRT